MRDPRRNQYWKRRSWPAKGSEKAFETEFSERYIDPTHESVPLPRERPQTPFTLIDAAQGVPVGESTGSIMDKVPVGTKPASPVVRQARFVNLAATVGLTAAQLLPSNRRRSYLLVQNTSANTIFVTFDRPASLTTGVEINPGGFYEPLTAPVSSVWAIASVADLLVVIVEGTT